MANSEYRLSVVVAELGEREAAEVNMERFVEAFDATHPDAGAVMAANYRLETLDATFTVEAKTAREAWILAATCFARPLSARGSSQSRSLRSRPLW